MHTPTRSLAAASTLTLLLAGCSAVDGVYAARWAPTSEPASPPLAQAIAPSSALAALPYDAGSIVSVVETRRTDGIDQKITLIGDAGTRGDNEIDVTTRRRNRNTVTTAVDEAQIRDEIAERLPGVTLSSEPRLVSSAAGPLGVLTGHGDGGTTCLYAWSSGNGARRRVDMARLLGVDGPENDDLNIRVRLCRRGVGEDRLVALAEGLRLRPDFAAGRPIATMAPVAAGRDALESAGYAGARTPTPAFAAPIAAPTVAAAWPPAEPAWTPAAAPAMAPAVAPVVAPRPVVATAPTHPAAPAAAAPKKPAVAHAAPPSATKPAAPSAPAPAAPAVVAVPIPLPTGG